MEIKEKSSFNLEIIISWEDWKNLDKGSVVKFRYYDWNGYLHMIHPCDPYNPESKLASLKKKDYGEVNRKTAEINIYLPHGVLRHSFISASRLSTKFGNLKVIPNSRGKPWDGAFIRVEYPGSFKVIDIPACWESYVEKVNSS